MAEIRLSSLGQGQTKFRNVPTALTQEGFWCCPSPAVFQNTIKAQNPLNKTKPSSPTPKTTVQKKQTPFNERKPPPTPLRSAVVSDDQRNRCSDTPGVSVSIVNERTPRLKIESLPRKVAIEFGEPGTSDMKVVLLGKQGFCVKLSVHKKVLEENSSFFANKLSEEESNLSCLEIDDCEDVEIYVETMGLMYCKEMKQRLIKQSVSRVLRILKFADLLSFDTCIQSCLEYLEAVPWVGEEEEAKVVSLVTRLQNEDTISHIMELVLKSNEEKGRREIKSIVLKLLHENSSLPGYAGSSDICNEAIYSSCRICLNSLQSLFKKAAEPEFTDKPVNTDRQAADEFALMWSRQQELTALHSKLPIVSRYHVSCITSRLFVGIGRGELLPSKDTRHLLLQTWLQPLISDYSWLQHGCRSFDGKVVEEGIGRTILTLPLQNQQTILLSWLGTFLKSGDNCPNLQRAFEVWWRRTFIRPHME
uniref:Uncharacterized protein n=1 Tax=Populus alba TaxID=43335 RepID=A0A4U5NNB0_POPAL|nr:hypothetical protein D5086_0000258460 [Populus alba]